MTPTTTPAERQRTILRSLNRVDPVSVDALARLTGVSAVTCPTWPPVT